MRIMLLISITDYVTLTDDSKQKQTESADYSSTLCPSYRPTIAKGDNSDIMLLKDFIKAGVRT